MSFMNLPPPSSQVTGLVPPYGDPHSPICGIGEAPARMELIKGQPFVGPAGDVLTSCCNVAGLARAEMYLTNVSKAPLEHKISELLQAGGLTQKGIYWRDQLKEELQSVTSNVYLAFGNLALYVMTGMQEITKRQGSIYDSTLIPGKKVIACIHPSSALYNNFIVRYSIVECLRRALKESEFPDIRLPDRNYIINPSWQDATDYISQFSRDKKIVSWDIEVFRKEVTCLSFSPHPKEAMCVPVDKYTTLDEAKVWKAIADVMYDEDVPKLGMNLIFDTGYILQHNKIKTRGYIDDIMVAHHILFPDLPKGLDFLVAFNCNGEPYYKDEGKQWKEHQIKNWDQFYIYNNKDSALAFDVWNAIKNKITEDGFFHYYRETMEYFDPINFMCLHGLSVDPSAIKMEQEKIIEIEKRKHAELEEIVGHELNPGSHTQCKKYFYEELGIPAFTKYNKATGKSAITLDDKALERLSKGAKNRPPLREAKLIQEIRSVRTLNTRYLEIKFDKDGRFRCSYNVRGTKNNRFASGKTIDGTGTNHQNLPESFRAYIIPDPGHVLINWDKRQAEWVVVAYLAGDIQMIQVVEKDLDAHTVSGSLITALPQEYITLENKYVGHSRDPLEIEEARMALDVWCMENKPDWKRTILQIGHPEAFWPRGYSIRQTGKHSNHGFNYDMHAARFALEYETELDVAQKIYNGYHRAYPMIKSWYKEVQEQLAKDRTIKNCYGDKRRFYGEWSDDLFKEAYDWGPQSTVSRNNKRGMVRIYNDTSSWMKPFRLLLECHDSNMGEYPLGNHNNLAKCIYTGLEHMHDDLTWNDRDFFIRTDVQIGFDWKNMIELKNLDKKQIGDLEKELPLLLEQAKEKHDESRREAIREIDSA